MFCSLINHALASEDFPLRVIFLVAFLFSLGSLTSACKKEEKFPSLGDRVVSPIDVAADASGQYFYALNSDYPRDYNAGSLLVLSTEGVKLGVTQLPRLGRSLTVAGNTLIITFSNSGESAPKIMLFDISSPAAPALAKTFEPEECNPINASAKASYQYWVVSCSNGKIFAGDLKTPLADSTLKLVRNYETPRRALHIDTSRNLLIAFPTDMGEQLWADAELTDAATYAADGTKTDVSDQIPDLLQDSKSERTNRAGWGRFQFAVYDLAAGAMSGWQAKEFKDTTDELRWIYFVLENFDGTPDVSQTTENINSRYYRTNFWEAKGDHEDSDVFYLSHRGSSDPAKGGSRHANSIIKVRIMGDLTAKTLGTDDVLTFERIYGFKGELDPNGRHFPGGFDIKTVQGKPLLLVNHFRDIINWPGQAYFSLAAKVIGENHWFAETSSTSTTKSYYQVALTPSGRAMAANFYGNSLILLDVTPGVGITERAITIQ